MYFFIWSSRIFTSPRAAAGFFFFFGDLFSWLNLFWTTKFKHYFIALFLPQKHVLNTPLIWSITIPLVPYKINKKIQYFTISPFLQRTRFSKVHFYPSLSSLYSYLFRPMSPSTFPFWPFLFFPFLLLLHRSQSHSHSLLTFPLWRLISLFSVFHWFFYFVVPTKIDYQNKQRDQRTTHNSYPSTMSPYIFTLIIQYINHTLPSDKRSRTVILRIFRNGDAKVSMRQRNSLKVDFLLG